MIVLWIILYVFIIWLIFHSFKHTKQQSSKVLPASNLTAYYIKKGDNDMAEVYRMSWVLSPSTFVEKQQVFASINGAAAAQLGADLPASQAYLDFQFDTGATVSYTVKCFGDNNTQAESEAFQFAALNGEAVAPATGLTASWIRHIA